MIRAYHCFQLNFHYLTYKRWMVRTVQTESQTLYTSNDIDEMLMLISHFETPTVLYVDGKHHI